MLLGHLRRARSPRGLVLLALLFVLVLVPLAAVWTQAGTAVLAQRGAPAGVFADAAMTVMGTAEDGLEVPRDLAFHNQPGRTDELWTVNRSFDGTVMWEGIESPSPKVSRQIDGFANHFMEEVSSIAFGTEGNFATCQESRNTYNGRGRPNDFMGPTLWDSDPAIYAVVNQPRPDADLLEIAGIIEGALCKTFDPNADGTTGATRDIDDAIQPNRSTQQLLGSHIDMLHQSPECMGIEHHEGNAYWVTDGKNGHVVYYDFRVDHGPGGDDHSDGWVRRYPDAPFTRVPDVPGHLVLDQETRWLYYADTGEGLVRRLDADSGQVDVVLPPRSEPLAEFVAMRGVTVETFASGLAQPSGIAIHPSAGLLLVGDHGTGEIVAYDLVTAAERGRLVTGVEGLMGITVDEEGTVWFVDGIGHQLVRVDVAPSAWPASPAQPTAPPGVEPTDPAPTPEPSATTAPTDVPTATATSTPEPTATATPTPEPTPWRTWLPMLLRR
jgi:hypothetical protein